MHSITLIFALAFGVAAITHHRLSPHTLNFTRLEDVQKLRGNIQNVTRKLQLLLGKDLRHSELVPPLRAFIKEAERVLSETKMDNAGTAMKKLQHTRAAMMELVSALGARQAVLMKETCDQKLSLLLGVLMSHKNDPPFQQFKILNATDFRDMDIAKVLLAKRDETKPLYMQAASYLDKQNTTAFRAKRDSHDLQSITVAFERRIEGIKVAQAEMRRDHQKRIIHLQNLLKDASTSDKHIIQRKMKHEQMHFQKWELVENDDLSTMQKVVLAIKNRNLKALQQARSALATSMKALQSNNVGFLVFMEMSHSLLGEDCPYCAAQCVDACHSAGMPYLTCLTRCADAGKSN